MRPPLDRTLDAYREQVLRWNSQINLVSRRETADRLERLILQSRHGWLRLREAALKDASRDSRLWYFDLGSGGGLPGFVWHLQAAAEEIPIRTLLVEPREKRAWFLNRLNALKGVTPFGVMADRWGSTSRADAWSGVPGDLSPECPTHILISLKALHLTDPEVLEGLIPFMPAGEGSLGAPKILIARFYPPGQTWSEDLARTLAILPEGGVRAFPEWDFLGSGGEILLSKAPRGASLVLSSYEASSR